MDKIRAIAKNCEAQLESALKAERNRQLKEKIEAGEDLTTFKVMGVETIRYDVPKIDLVRTVTLDSIFRDLAMMELREEITPEEREEIEDYIQ